MPSNVVIAKDSTMTRYMWSFMEHIEEKLGFRGTVAHH